MIDGIITVRIKRVLHWATDNRNGLTACGESWVRGKNRRGETSWPNPRLKSFCRACAKALDDKFGTGAPVPAPNDPAAPTPLAAAARAER